MELVPDSFCLKPVAHDRARISGAALGAHEYYGCTWDGDHFALCNMSLMSTLQGFTTLDALEG